MRENPERKDQGVEKKPRVLDIVKIDDRWVQILGGGDVVRFLDDGTAERIDWNEYMLVRKFAPGFVEAFNEVSEEALTETEIENIHVQGDENDISLKKKANMFGVYKKLIST